MKSPTGEEPLTANWATSVPILIGAGTSREHIRLVAHIKTKPVV